MIYKINSKKDFEKITEYNKKNDWLEFQCCKCGNTTKKRNFDPEFICKTCNQKLTSLKKYGSESYFKTDAFKEKYKKTCMNRYGVTNAGGSTVSVQKIKLTKKERYGSENYCNTEKIKQTTAKHYGVSNYLKTDECKNKRQITRKIKSYDFHLRSFNKEKYEIITTLEEFQKTFKLKYKCKSCGNIFQLSPQRNYAIICKKCYKNSGTSNSEKEVYQFVSSIYKGPIDLNTKKIITPKEIDIFIPEKNLAIEYDGLFWHSENPNAQIDKTTLCSNKKISLIHIFENEWEQKRSIVESIIKSKLGIFDHKIFAKQCSIKEISNLEYKKFTMENHIQGYAMSKIRLGLFYDNRLIQIMSFSKPRMNKSYEYEMIRECSKKGFQIVGGKSKLLKYFERNFSPKSIISYCDKRYFTGSSYLALGFEKLKDSDPNFWYFKNHTIVLQSRIKFQKHKLEKLLDNFDYNLTERENMSMNGYNRIYDSGNFVFRKLYNT